MQIIDKNSHLWGDDLKQALTKGPRVKIAASCFSINAYEGQCQRDCTARDGTVRQVECGHAPPP